MTMFPYPRTRFSILIAVAALVLTAGGPVAAEEASFAGKRLNAIIGATSGGGTDLTTRLIGRFLEKYLPGKPQVVYRNMPAGNGVQATNYFANEASRDGTFWMGGGNAYIDAQVLRQSTVKYDPRTFHFIGGISRGGSILSLRAEKLPNLTDRSLPPVIVGTGDGTGTWEEMLCWGAEVLGWNIRFVVGYPGTSAMVLALRRGEIDSLGTSNLNMLDGLRQQGGYKEFVQIGEMRDGKVVPRAYAPDVPTMNALIEGKLTGVAKDSFAYWTDSNQIDKWYALPPGTPDAVVAAYRTALEKVMADPDFIKAGKLQIDPDFGFQTAEEVTRLVRDTSYPSVAITAYTHDLRVKHGLPGAPLSKEELARLTAKLVGSAKTATSSLTGVENGGRVVVFQADGTDHKGNVSSSRTKITIAGKAAKRDDLKAGMTCDIAYTGDGGDLTAIACK
jgi:tripartite-type tricarboxylate transporter receptor subunit TctC